MENVVLYIFKPGNLCTNVCMLFVTESLLPVFVRSGFLWTSRGCHCLLVTRELNNAQLRHRFVLKYTAENMKRASPFMDHLFVSMYLFSFMCNLKIYGK